MMYKTEERKTCGGGISRSCEGSKKERWTVDESFFVFGLLMYSSTRRLCERLIEYAVALHETAHPFVDQVTVEGLWDVSHFALFLSFFPFF